MRSQNVPHFFDAPWLANQRRTNQMSAIMATTTAATIHQLMLAGSSSAAEIWEPNTEVASTPGSMPRNVPSV